MRVHPLAPVVGIDIDGNLGDYHNHFTWFLNNVYYPYRTWFYRPDWSMAKEGEFSEALGMEKADYRAAKLAYRMGGLKRCMPLFENDQKHFDDNAVKREVQYLRSQGIQVWICTTRPWQSMMSIDLDTQYWIENNIGQVDGLIYGEDKYLDLVDIVGQERILGVVDDLPENIIRAQQLGLKSAIRRQDHNAWWPGTNEWPDSFSRIKDMSSIVDGWMENYNGTV